MGISKRGKPSTLRDVATLMWSSYGFGFAEILRTVRTSRGMSQQALSEISGVSRNQISNLERNTNGRHSMADPALSTVYRLALALEVPPSVLLPGAEDTLNAVLGTRDTWLLPDTEIQPFPEVYIDQRRMDCLEGLRPGVVPEPKEDSK